MPLDWINLMVLLQNRFANPGGFALTNHARQRRSQRNISIEDIINCVFTGTIIEEQAHSEDPKVLIHGLKKDGTAFYIVVALTDYKPVVVTVCTLDEDAWEVIAGIPHRK